MTDLRLKVSASPHVHSEVTTRKIMLFVVLALLPTSIASIVIFGPRSLLVQMVAVSSAVAFEWISRRVMKRRNTIQDLSAVVTGLLLAFNLPVTIPIWMIILGSAVAIVLVKQCFGGIGMNFVNPALMARIVLLSSFPEEMATWQMSRAWTTGLSNLDSMTTASPLAHLGEMLNNPDLTTDGLPSLLDMFLGLRAGSLGETVIVTLIIGALFLLITRVIKPLIPLSFLGTFAIMMIIASGFDITYTLYQLMSGGLMLGALFMATDYTTSPLNDRGRLVFGIGCGLITGLIRIFGALPEGVSFAIILMNILVPHIEKLTARAPFGTEKKRQGRLAFARTAKKEGQ